MGRLFFSRPPTLGGRFSHFIFGVSDMTQTSLNRAIARATGESLSTIRSLGFSIANPDDVSFDPEQPRRRRHHVVDWDRLDAQRGGYLPQRTRC